MNPDWPHPANIADFSYSRLSHFELFRDLPFRSHNVGDPDPATCDLKVYQDYLTYCFIRRSVPGGARILEVGGGDSRILRFLSTEYECWSADKCEGFGNGPVQFTSPHYRTVFDYVGSFNRELPDAYFDLVFSISALEHTPEDQEVFANILADINRVLKRGRPSFHCFDAVLYADGTSWVNGLIPYLGANAPLTTPVAPMREIQNNSDTYVMSQAAYDATWQSITGVPYSVFGRPLSINLCWTSPQR